MSDGVEQVRTWCEEAALSCREDDGDLLVRLEDAEDAPEVRLTLDDEGALRLLDRVPLAPGDLPSARLADVVEDVVLGRSSLVDARVASDGHAAEVVLVIHADGLSRHTVLQATYELQKVRLLLRREVAAALAAEHTMAALAAMADEAWARDQHESVPG